MWLWSTKDCLVNLALCPKITLVAKQGYWQLQAHGVGEFHKIAEYKSEEEARDGMSKLRTQLNRAFTLKGPR